MTNRWRAIRSAAAACGLALLAAGCGRPGDVDGFRASRGGPTTPEEIIRRVTRVGAIYDIYSVDPNQGPLAGGNPVQLTGVFPAGAQANYTVFFGNNFTGYNPGVINPMTSSNVFVLAPPGDAPGLVNVVLFDLINLTQAAALYYSYEYLDTYDLTAVIPNVGPTAGGQQVRIEGRFPIMAPFATAAAAYTSYRAYFRGNPAAFDSSFNPVMTSDAMYVITPPGFAGLANVSVATVVPPSQSPDFRVLVDGYEYLDPFDVIDVDPDTGWIFGFEQVRIEGTFPVTTAFSSSLNAISASNYYYVQFGNRLAQFDPFITTPVITANSMYVLSPPGEDIGFVDVTVGAFDGPNNVVAVETLSQAYRYYGMYMLRAVPNQGPVAGGNEVRLEGIFPGLAAISNVYAAEAIYEVYFAYNQAPLAAQPFPDPVFFPSQIDTINQTYTMGFMYVTAPAGPLGFVDVQIDDETGVDLSTICPDCYEYIDDTIGIGRWDTAEIFPNPVGKLLPRELRVRITGIGAVERTGSPSTGPAFIVPQGGNPANTNHHILLEETFYEENGSSFTWEGTNIAAIPRVMRANQTDELLVDGHAAIYLDAGDGDIIGDSTDLSDGGVISQPAQEGRHFIIDTIPPRLVARLVGTSFVLRGDDLVTLDVPTGPYETTVANVPISISHPYPLPSAAEHIAVSNDATYDGNTLTRPKTEGSVAQVFFNVASVSNGFLPTENLQFLIDNVVFEDVDIYTMMGETVVPSRDTDFFTGSTARQQAGFATGLNVTLDNLPRDEAFLTDPYLLVSGQFQSSPFSLPDITDIDVTFSIPLGAPLTGDGSGAALSPNLAQTPAQMVASYAIGDVADATTGVDVNSVDSIGLIPIVFRAVDRAGDYSPLLAVPDPNTRKKLWTSNDTTPTEGYVTTQQPDMGPVNLWWLRTTGTRVISNVAPNGDAANPSFSWEPSISPIPPGQLDAGADGVQRLYNVAIFRNPLNTGLSRDELRDGPYEMLTGWLGWASATALTNASDVLLGGFVADRSEIEGVWFLMVVMSVDEAGNVELWPYDNSTPPNPGPATQLDISTATIDGGQFSPNRIENVFEPGSEERNWERWYVPPVAETIDTLIEPFFWHDAAGGFIQTGTVDPGENTFGNAEVIPYPAPALFSPLQGVPGAGAIGARVAAQFRMTLVTADEDATLSWSLTENGQLFGPFTLPQNPSGSFLVDVFLPEAINVNGFLGSANRTPTYYTFQAATVNTDGTQDSSPATFSFVVVDNVANFVRNPDEVQPIRESDVN